jgi:hypothetical protein
MEHKLIDGVQVPLTAEEIAQRQADELAWERGAFDRAISDLRARRNKALKDSDWSVLNDVPLNPANKSAWMNYRTLLRNLTDNLSTVEDVKAVTLPIAPQ